MKEKKITLSSGTICWKSPMEYNSDLTLIDGYPYYYITEVDRQFYLWELDRKNPDSKKYYIIKSGYDFSKLHQEGMQLNRVIREEKANEFGIR